MSLTIEGPLSWRWNEVLIPKFTCQGFWPSSNPRSPPFRYRDSNWWFECCDKQDFICLHLYPNISFEDIVPITVFVQVEEGNENGEILPELCDRKHKLPTSGGCIWWRFTDDIQRSYPEFERDHKLTFQITIKEENSQTSLVSDASTLTECLESVTASLLTANDIPANSSTHDSSSTDSSEANSCINHSKIQTPLSPSTSPCLVQLSEDFEKLLDEESYSDVEFHCEDFSTKAHRAVVSTRSPVLARVVEGKTIVEIKDMDANTFKQFSRYLYTGNLDELTFDAAIPLHKAAGQYEVCGLASRCSEFISKNLTEDNAYEVLMMADSHSDMKFVEVVVEYMLMHKFPLSDDRWSKFSDDQPRLANEVLNRIPKNGNKAFSNVES